MSWVFDDGGRAAAGFKGRTGDCVTRAVAIATGMPYAAVYDLVHERSAEFLSKTRSRKRLTRTGKARSASPRDGAYREVYGPLLADLGWIWTPTMSIGSGTTMHLDADELPGGTLVVRVSKHLVAVKDGVVHDTYDCTREGRRAVYGYYSKAA
jgi:hypothetical protein